MECNKDEAVRAKEIAERKFTERDFSGSKKFVLKAQNLYPGLEGLTDLLTTLDVHISAENKIAGESDWYGVLGVNPWADDETVKKQYRKLALTLHPDKNKCIGAEGAFKLVSEAWSLLSDKTRRLAYNQKRNSRGFQQKVPTQGGVPSFTPANGFHNFTSNATSNSRTRDNSSRVGSTSVPTPSYQKSNTFWTICNRCKTHYEYLRMYLNHTLLCPNCHEAFLAIEKAPPPSVFKSANLPSRQQHQSSRHHVPSNNPSNPGGLGGGNSFDYTNFQRGSVPSASTAGQAQAAGEWERSYASKRTSNSALKVDKPLKKRRIDDDRVNGYGSYVANQMAMGNGVGVGCASGPRKGNSEGERIYGFSTTSNMPNSNRELSLFEMRNMLMEKARIEICSKLKEWRAMAGSHTADKERENKKQKSTANGNARSQNKKGYQNKKSISGVRADDTDKEVLTSMSMNVPDPDFHNFDMDRTEKSFGDDQVWAAYDDDDGMPRYYARIHKVMSLKPFRMRFSWLNSRSNSEFGPLDWTGSGFYKTCGDFRVGRYESTGSLNSFSHKVEWTKGTRGVICIYPRKGDVWALYRNWSPDWNEHTPDELVHKYDMVEVLDDYNEEQGVSVTPLVKVAGFRTVFRKHIPGEIRKIPKEEMFRFSHQVPNYLLTGEEAPNAPKGCRELDPAATPLEFLQVITEADKAAMANGGRTEEEMLQSAQEVKVDEMLTDASRAKEFEIVENCKQTKDEEILVHTNEFKKAEVLESAEKAVEVECGD